MDFGNFGVILGIGIFVLLFGGLIYFSIHLEKKRREALQKISSTLGFEFQPAISISELAEIQSFKLFGQGHSARTKNLLRGNSDGLAIMIFDFSYTTGHGKNRNTHSQTVFALSDPRKALPNFSISPENVFHKIGSAFGYQDIDFDSHPEFSKHYLVRAEDETSIRRTLTPSILSYFEKNAGISVEGGGPHIIFYRARMTVKPEQIKEKLEHGKSLIRMFGS